VNVLNVRKVEPKRLGHLARYSSDLEKRAVIASRSDFLSMPGCGRAARGARTVSFSANFSTGSVPSV
jgi:hypothetical protein